MKFKYRCPACKKVTVRKIERAPKIWMKSFCMSTGRDVRLRLIVEE
jgi:ribosomal protein L37AE/L43A